MRLTKAQATLALAFAAAVAIGNAWTLANAISEQRGLTAILVFAVSTIATIIAVGIAARLLWPRPRHRARSIHPSQALKFGFLTVSEDRELSAAVERDRARVRKWAANL
jgi:hypothetical protein